MQLFKDFHKVLIYFCVAVNSRVALVPNLGVGSPPLKDCCQLMNPFLYHCFKTNCFWQIQIQMHEGLT